MDQTKNYIRALEEEQNGNWSLAHGIIQEIDTEEAAWIHAYLHRVEGELGNAAYWYRRAGRPECTSTFKAEWTEIMEAVQR